MKKIIILANSLLLLFSIFSYSYNYKNSSIKVNKFPFYIYNDANKLNNHYTASGWMGDWKDLNYNEEFRNNPFSGKTCIKIKYSALKKQKKGWAGIYWLNPANNWARWKRGGYDLSKAKTINFYAKGKKGGEVVSIRIGGVTGKYPDSDITFTNTIKLKKYWKKYTINLQDNMDLSYIIGGYSIILKKSLNKNGCTIYLDNIYYN